MYFFPFGISCGSIPTLTIDIRSLILVFDFGTHSRVGKQGFCSRCTDFHIVAVQFRGFPEHRAAILVCAAVSFRVFRNITSAERTFAYHCAGCTAMVKFQVEFRTTLRTVAGQDTVVFLTGFLAHTAFKRCFALRKQRGGSRFRELLADRFKELVILPERYRTPVPVFIFPDTGEGFRCLYHIIAAARTSAEDRKVPVSGLRRFNRNILRHDIFDGLFREFQNIDTGQGPVLDRVQLLGEIYRYRNIKVDSEFSIVSTNRNPSASP